MKKEYWIVTAGCILILVSVGAAYHDIINHKLLAWDDKAYVLENPNITEFNLKNLFWMFTDYNLGNWHPITWISYAFNYTLWGPSPLSFKITNIFLHFLNSILIVILVSQFLRKTIHNISPNNLYIASFITGWLFAIHPQHVESVTWVAERKELLCALFYIATIISYLYQNDHPQRKNLKYLTITLFIFALMSKPMAVSLPVVLVLLDIYPLGKLSEKGIVGFIKFQLKDKITFIIVSLLVSVITIITQRQGIQGLVFQTLDTRIINSCMSLIFYVYKFIIPVNLSPLYPFHEWSTHPGIFSLIPVVTVLCVTAGVVLLWRRNFNFPLILWIYYIVTLLPVIGLVKVGTQAAADRYAYIPMIGFYILLGAGLAFLLASLTDNFKKAIFCSTAAVILVMSGYLTHQQNLNWRYDELLWKKAINEYPGRLDVAYANLGSAYFRQKKYQQAIVEYNKVLTINPKDITVKNNIAKTYIASRRYKLAEYQFKDIIAVAPEAPLGYMLLGDYYYKLKKYDLAAELYYKSYKADPTVPATLQRAAIADMATGQRTAAKKKLNYLLMIDPENIGALQVLIKILRNQKRSEEALAHTKRILQLRPDDSFALQTLYELAEEEKLRNESK